MRRYAIFILTALTITISAVAGIVYPAGADKKNFGVPLQELTAYTDLPPETVSILSETYEKQSNVRVNFVPLAPNDLVQKVRDDSVSDSTVVKTVDIVLADSKILNQLAELNLFTPHVSETGDAVKEVFKDNYDRWTGVWYDPIVFCFNRDYMKKIYEIPDTWKKISNFKARIGITDFLAADASSNLMFQMIGQFGDEETFKILNNLHPNIVQYTKYLSNPVRQAGMNETDISIAVESETLRYMQNGYPLKIVYPADGTSYLLTGFGITSSDATKNSAAAKFADWLLSDEAQRILQANGFYFIPTNPQTLAYKTFAGKNLKLFDNTQKFTAQQRHQFLDRWIKEIRVTGR